MTSENLAVPQVSDLAAEALIVKALRVRGGRATLGDISVDTGLARHVAQSHAQRLLSVYESHLAVDEDGELVYEFDPGFVRRDVGDGLQLWLRTAGLWAWKAFKTLFKISIMVTLVAYFVFFVVLIIAAVVALLSRGGSSSSSDSRRSPITPLFWVGRVFWVPDSSRHRGRRRGRRGLSRSEQKQEPLYKRIFAYVFGPEAANDSEEDPFGDEKRILEFIRAKKGVISASELAAHTGWTRTAADNHLAGLMFRHEGDVRVTNNGTLLYTFAGVAKSVSSNRPVAKEAWTSFEPKRVLTGNKSGTNFAITFFNGFNLVMSFFAGSLLSFVLEQPLDLWVHFAVGVFPLLFSLVFFAVPLTRVLMLIRENAKRAGRNSWRFLQREIYERAWADEAVTTSALVDGVTRRWPAKAPGEARPGRIERQVQEAALDYDADVGDYGDAGHSYRFSALSRELHEASLARGRVRKDQLTLGKIVFSTAEDDLGLDRLDEFDEQVRGAPQYSAEELAELSPDLAQFDEVLAAATAEEKEG
jgi:hypothetical protein